MTPGQVQIAICVPNDDILVSNVHAHLDMTMAMGMAMAMGMGMAMGMAMVMAVAGGMAIFRHIHGNKCFKNPLGT